MVQQQLHRSRAVDVYTSVLPCAYFAHYIAAVLSKLKITSLEAQKKEAKQKYQEHLQAYVKFYMGHPMEKLHVSILLPVKSLLLHFHHVQKLIQYVCPDPGALSSMKWFHSICSRVTLSRHWPCQWGYRFAAVIELALSMQEVRHSRQRVNIVSQLQWCPKWNHQRAVVSVHVWYCGHDMRVDSWLPQGMGGRKCDSPHGVDF